MNPKTMSRGKTPRDRGCFYAFSAGKTTLSRVFSRVVSREVPPEEKPFSPKKPL
jgi:hypothetical protein